MGILKNIVSFWAIFKIIIPQFEEGISKTSQISNFSKNISVHKHQFKKQIV